MPTLFRLFSVIVFLVGLFYAAMFALTWYVEPNVGEITIRVPVDRLNPVRRDSEPAAE